MEVARKAQNVLMVLMAMLLAVGRYCDFLRENGVYDNTRIIVVSDHGSDLGLHPERIITGEANGSSDTRDTMIFECLLMVQAVGGIVLWQTRIRETACLKTA